MNELQGELHQLEAWERLPAGGGDNSAPLQDELGQAHAGLPEAGLALWEGEGRPLEAIADALAGELSCWAVSQESSSWVQTRRSRAGENVRGASASTPTGDRLRAQHTSPRQWLRLYSTGQPGK